MLAELSSAVRSKEIILLPQTYAFDYGSVQDGARSEIESQQKSGHMPAYYQPINAAVDAWYASRGQTKAANDDTARHFSANVKLAGQVCSTLDFTPVAGSELVHTILRQEHIFAKNILLAADKTNRVTSALSSYIIPGIADTDIDTILKLRHDEKVFDDFRRQFGNVLDQVAKEQPTDQESFEVNFKQACDDILNPQVAELKKKTQSSALEKFVILAGLTLGAGGIAYFFGKEYPITATAGAALGPLSWVLDKLRKRWNSSGRKDQRLIEAYGLLTTVKK